MADQPPNPPPQRAYDRCALLEFILDELADAITVVDESGALVYQNRRAATAPEHTAAHSPFMLVKEKQAAVAAPSQGKPFCVVQSPSAAVTGEGPPPCLQPVVEEAAPPSDDPPTAGDGASAAAMPQPPSLTLRVYSSLTRHPVVERVLDSTSGLHMWVNSVGPASGMEFVTTWWWRDHLHTTKEALQDRSVFGKLIHPHDLPRVLDFSRRSATRMTTECIEFRYFAPLPDGTSEVRWQLATISPVKDDRGHICKLFGVGADITDLKATQSRLAEQQQLLSTVIEQLPVAVGVVHPSGRCIMQNRIGKELFPACTKMTTTGDLAVMDVFDADGVKVAVGDMPIVNALQGRTVRGAQLTVVHPDDGSRRTYRLYAAPVINAEGGIIAATYAAEDLTYQLQVDQERARSHAVSRLLSNASHELRTPLNGIIATLELLGLTSLTDEQSEYASTMRESAQHLLVVVSDLLDYNKLAEGKLQLEAVPIRPRDVARAAIAMIVPVAQAKGLNLLVDVSECEGLQVLGDGTRLKQMLLNYLSNAVRFTPAGGTVELAAAVTRPPGGDAAGAEAGGDDRVCLRFDVADSGIGISEVALQRLWAPFMQADVSTTRSYGGTGLGLSLVKNMAGLMGGTVGVKSAVGVGSRFWFTVTLPIVADAPPVEDSPAAGASGCSGRLLHRMTADALAAALAPPLGSPVGSSPALPHRLASPTGSTATTIRTHRTALLAGAGDCSPSSLVTDDSPSLASIAAGGRRARDTTSSSLSVCAAAAATQVDAAIATSRQPTLLVAEDNATNVLVMRRMLAKLGYSDVVVAGNGQEAVDAVVSCDIDLFFCDVHMPVLDGLEATQRVRALPAHKARVPIIAVTAGALEADKVACAEAGTDATITKPFTMADLAASLRRYLPRDCVQPSFAMTALPATC